MDKWESLNFTLWRMGNAEKINIIPRLIYILRGIPVQISGKYFQKINSLFRKFSWGSAIPRTYLHKMQLPINEREFNFSNLELYHQKYLFSSFKYWKPTIGVNFWMLTSLEYTYMTSLAGRTVLGSKYRKLLSLKIVSVGKIWNVILNLKDLILFLMLN